MTVVPPGSRVEVAQHADFLVRGGGWPDFIVVSGEAQASKKADLAVSGGISGLVVSLRLSVAVLVA